MMVGTSASAQNRRTNRLAIASLVCGIVLYSGLLPAGLAAIILGHMARRQIRRTGDVGHGLAGAGLILGYVGLVLAILVTVIAALGSAHVVRVR